MKNSFTTSLGVVSVCIAYSPLNCYVSQLGGSFFLPGLEYSPPVSGLIACFIVGMRLENAPSQPEYPWNPSEDRPAGTQKGARFLGRPALHR